MDLGPRELKSLGDAELLEVMEFLSVLSNVMRTGLRDEAVGGKEASSFTDVPFNRMEAVAAIRDMGNA